MSAVLATVMGVSYDLVLLITTIVASLATGGAMLAIVFFAWAPYVSGSWATQFGVGRLEDEPDAD